MDVRLQTEPFDPGMVATSFARGRRDVGAVVTFTGLVRDDPDNPLDAMEIEHYPGMTELALREHAQNAVARWSLRDVLILHRFGRMVPGEPIMMVATAAGHRREAFEAADYLMDYLKSRAPFWKKEIHAAGGEAWVDAKDHDEAALARW